MLSTIDSPAQVEAVLGVLQQEMKAARESPAEVRAALREAITGKGTAPATPTPAPATKRFKFDAQGNPVK